MKKSLSTIVFQMLQPNFAVNVKESSIKQQPT